MRCLMLALDMQYHDLHYGWLQIEAGHFFPFRILEFVMGMLAAQLYDSFPRAVRMWCGWGWVFDTTCVLIIAARGHVEPPTPSPGIIVRVLGFTPLVIASQYSFGAYIYQYSGFFTLQCLGITVAHGPFCWVPFAAAWAFAVASEHFLESPLRKAVEARSRAGGGGLGKEAVHK